MSVITDLQIVFACAFVRTYNISKERKERNIGNTKMKSLEAKTCT